MTTTDPRTGPVRAVVFDYGGVLCESPFTGIRTFETEMGYPTDSVKELLLGGYSSGTATDLYRVEVGELALDEFLVAVRDEQHASDAGWRFDPVAYREFLDSAPFGSYWMVVHRARRLRTDGVRTAILTNTVREWGPAWRSTVPVHEFDDVIDSSEVGLRKPDPRIYELTCSRLEVATHEAVFLDDIEENVEGARAVGMDGIHVVDPRDALAELDQLIARRSATG